MLGFVGLAGSPIVIFKDRFTTIDAARRDLRGDVHGTYRAAKAAIVDVDSCRVVDALSLHQLEVALLEAVLSSATAGECACGGKVVVISYPVCLRCCESQEGDLQ